jgi:hypothetical protein
MVCPLCPRAAAKTGVSAGFLKSWATTIIGIPHHGMTRAVHSKVGIMRTAPDRAGRPHPLDQIGLVRIHATCSRQLTAFRFTPQNKSSIGPGKRSRNSPAAPLLARPRPFPGRPPAGFRGRSTQSDPAATARRPKATRRPHAPRHRVSPALQGNRSTARAVASRAGVLRHAVPHSQNRRSATARPRTTPPLNSIARRRYATSQSCRGGLGLAASFVSDLGGKKLVGADCWSDAGSVRGGKARAGVGAGAGVGVGVGGGGGGAPPVSRAPCPVPRAPCPVHRAPCPVHRAPNGALLDLRVK